jgi:hypothetical protein
METERRQIQRDSGLQRLKSFEKGALRTIFGPKGDEVTTGRRSK